jgi:hypothetical protein
MIETNELLSFIDLFCLYLYMYIGARGEPTWRLTTGSSSSGGAPPWRWSHCSYWALWAPIGLLFHQSYWDPLFILVIKYVLQIWFLTVLIISSCQRTHYASLLIHIVLPLFFSQDVASNHRLMCKLHNLTPFGNIFHKWTRLKTYSRSKTFFTNGPAWKHIPDLNPLKGARPVGVLIVLRGDKGFATLPSTSKRIKIEGHTIGALLELNATDVGIMFCMWFILFNIFTWLKIIIYITLKSRVIFLFIEKCIMNKFCHCEKLQFIIV